jgi:tRNA(Ile)-lysidine synthase
MCCYWHITRMIRPRQSCIDCCEAVGQKGWQGYRHSANWARVACFRPLLDVPRHSLEIWAKSQQIVWIEDESNAQDGADRNFLRNQILPLIQQRWPGYLDTWTRSADLCRESDTLLEGYVAQHFSQALSTDPWILQRQALVDLPVPLCRRVLRHWLDVMHRQYGVARPDSRHLQRMVEDVVHAQASANPRLQWGDAHARVELRRYREALYLMPCQTAVQPVSGIWQLNTPYDLGHGYGSLVMEPVSSHGIDLQGVDSLTVKFRQGGENVQPAGRKKPLSAKDTTGAWDSSLAST